MSDDLAEIRRGVSDLGTALALHDQKVASNADRISDSQDRMATAIERIGDATVSIQALTEQIRANGKSSASHGLPLDRRMIAFGMLVLVIAAVAAGGGAELVAQVFVALRK